MSNIHVTVIITVVGEDRTQIFTRSYESIIELQNDLPGVNSEDWQVTTVRSESE